jgi:3-deoxy-manno-octulosonate cytidylyltransferase (CMP-KDO synthetase)
MPVVNVQGDAPLLPAVSIRRVANLLMINPSAGLATLCVPLRAKSEYLDPNIVKVVFDKTGRALYFSRAGIPAGSHGSDAEVIWRLAWRHLGLYAYRPAALTLLSQTPPCAIEETERLEQLRALWLGMTIMVEADAEVHGPDVDTEADLAKVAAIMRAESRQNRC